MEEDIFKEFKEHSVAEFFKKNRHMLGYSGKIRSLTTAVHELVTNSLDACEEAGILPDIRVDLVSKGEEHYLLRVRDNGPGIPPHIVPKVFGKLLAGTKFHRMIQTRGQQGIGAAGVTLFSQITTGKPVRIKTSTGDGNIWYFEVMVDVRRNEPKVVSKQREEGSFRGTEVEVELKEVEYNRGKYSVYEYLRRTSVANPHAAITFREPSGKVYRFERSSFEPVKIGIEAKLHPFGVTADDIFTLSRITKSKSVGRMFVNELHGIGGTAVREISGVLGSLVAKKPSEMTWEEAEKIMNTFRAVRLLQENKVARKIVESGKIEGLSQEEEEAMKEIVRAASKIKGKRLERREAVELLRPLLGVRIRAPRTDVLIPIGEERIRASLKAHFKPSFLTVRERRPKVYSGGIPFQVEVGIAMGGEIEGFELMRFANRVPLLFDAGGCAITDAVRSVDWKRYGIPDITQAPVVIVVNISSTHVPYTTAGKQAIADIPEVKNEIRQALMEAGRKVREYVNKVKSLNELMQKRKILEHYLPEVARSLAEILGEDEKELEELLRGAIEKKFRVEEMGVVEA